MNKTNNSKSKGLSLLINVLMSLILSFLIFITISIL